MSDDQQQGGLFGLSRFDTVVAGIVLLLVIAVAALAYWSNPSRQGAMVAYLYPASGDPPNLWIAPVARPDEARQITFSPVGIYDFDTDQNGHWIAYSRRDDETLNRDIHLLDLQSGNSRRLTFCGDNNAECYNPVFHPDHTVIAYVKVFENTGEGSFGVGAPRIWLLDLTSNETRPLANDSQLIGHSPLWSEDGNTIAYYNADLASPGVMIYNFDPQVNDGQSLTFVPALNGSVGSLAPNGRKLIVPDIVNRGEQIFTFLKIVDLTLSPPTFENFTDPNDPIDDISLKWHPNGAQVTVARRYLDNRWTRGYQLYTLDVSSNAITPLVVNERYSHNFFTWNQTGTHLLMQRLPLLTEDGSINNLARPEVWVLDAETDDLILISSSGYLPRWVLAP